MEEEEKVSKGSIKTTSRTNRRQEYKGNKTKMDGKVQVKTQRKRKEKGSLKKSQKQRKRTTIKKLRN